jgi:beta-lactamase class D
MKNIFSALQQLLSSKTSMPQWQPSPTLARVFNSNNAQGTFVLYDSSAHTVTGHDPARAEQRFSPDSTFKVVNSLIGLATGAISSLDDVLPYGGKPQPFQDWQHDLDLHRAIKVSSVPIYQELARRIGLERMREQLRRLNYGNAEVGETVDQFWLTGPLMISAMEQARFMARLAQHELPVSEKIQAAVRELVYVEQGQNWVLYGKTGWSQHHAPDLGWWVGWVEKQGLVYSFALNVDMPNPQDRQIRIELGKACLKALGIL